ncbi:DUF4149 domain-containing protein [Numidum massiliense]|uniref:DUF4149 domain-containing protein n=1 Tax=Numidum massiliense TaxID=1522315 RepID=UPI0006D5761D|nr:DUF4149 domain-containing protein [Numidum massiliense]
MRAIVNWLFLLSIVCWLGSVMFFELLLIPKLKTAISIHQYYEVLNVVRPIPYQLGLVVGLLVLLIALFRTLRAERPKRLLKWIVLLLLMMFALNCVATFIVLPQMDALQGKITSFKSATSDVKQFTKLQSYTQMINLLQCLFGLFVLLFTAVDMRILPAKPIKSGYSFHG